MSKENFNNTYCKNALGIVTEEDMKWSEKNALYNLNSRI